ncbi:MAG: TenA family protein [Desulfobacterales bacterium]|nr:TenA family protein [Desulfobacterales bacterium]
MKAAGKYTQKMWDAVASIYADTISHPFIVQLAKGTLDKNNFAHFLSQDILYLKDDNLALNLLAGKAPSESEKQFFQRLAKDGLDIEKALHNEFLKYFDIEEAEEKSPVIEKYTSFLLGHSKNSVFALAAAALLPCFWVFNSVGNHILTIAEADNKYQMWIDTYHSDAYEQYTQRFIDIVERQASGADEELHQEMLKAFTRSAQYELDFFEEAMKT